MTYGPEPARLNNRMLTSKLRILSRSRAKSSFATLELKMKWIRQTGIVVLLAVVSIVGSVLSMRIQMGTDDSDRETIGIQQKRGFPITYRTTAPGLSWADFNGFRFGMNTLAWATLLGTAWILANKLKKRSSNRVAGD